MAFTVTDPQRELSPYTGMGRRHWMDVARFYLAGILQHVRRFDAPMTMPGEEEGAPVNLEALARTFMIAAPLIADNPDEAVAGINLRDYYASQIRATLHPDSPHFIDRFPAASARRNRPTLGHTVEGAALSVGLWMAGEAIWERYSREDRDAIADVVVEVANNRTNSHNWRWFNVLMASYMKTKGYAPDEQTMLDHLQNLLAYYVGDGWYRDGAQFDFYSCWAFQFYGPIWCRLYGYAQAPEIAAIIERYHLDLQRTYPMVFGRNGHMPMWGRSIIYRHGASAPLAAAFLLNRQEVDPGWARRIASGNILQFAGRDDVFEDGVPSLGFYRRFPAIVQTYSHPASPYWLGKLFVALHLPAESPFWTATENEGDWPQLGGQSKTVSLPGPGLTLTMHGSTGTAELRPGKVNSKNPSLLYTRLVYNTAFPGEDDNPQGATTGAYAVRQVNTELGFTPSVNLKYAGERDGVLYRQADLPGWMARADLAEIIVPGGVLRVDRLSLAFAHDLRLGHFALPHVDGQAPAVRQFQVDGHPALTAHGADGRALAMVAYRGWDGLDVEVHAGISPEADESTVPYAGRVRTAMYSGMALLITLLLHRTDGGEWGDEDLSPIAEMTYLPWAPSGSPCGLRLRLKDGRELLVDFRTLSGEVMV